MQNNKITSERFRLKQVLVFALLFMIVGSLLELYLLDHYEDTWQLIPILSVGTTLVTLLILFFKKTTKVVNLFKAVLILTALSGVYGVFLHLRNSKLNVVSLKQDHDINSAFPLLMMRHQLFL